MIHSQGDYLANLPLVTIPVSELASPHANDLWNKLRAGSVRAYWAGRTPEAYRIIEYLGGLRFKITPELWSRDIVTLEPTELIALVDYDHFRRMSKPELIRALAGYFISDEYRKPPPQESLE